jgi:hypothetical protein
VGYWTFAGDATYGAITNYDGNLIVPIECFFFGFVQRLIYQYCRNSSADNSDIRHNRIDGVVAFNGNQVVAVDRFCRNSCKISNFFISKALSRFCANRNVTQKSVEVKDEFQLSIPKSTQFACPVTYFELLMARNTVKLEDFSGSERGQF